MKLMRIQRLQQAGYPLAANDLALEEWFDLAEVTRALERPPMCPMTHMRR